jgi:hypothetical protein
MKKKTFNNGTIKIKSRIQACDFNTPESAKKEAVPKISSLLNFLFLLSLCAYLILL